MNRLFASFIPDAGNESDSGQNPLIQSPVYLLLVMMLVVFSGETLVMYIISSLDIQLDTRLEALLDAAMLTLVAFPFMYLFMFHPLTRALQHSRMSEERIRINEASFHNVVSGSADGILIIDEDGTINFVNSSTESILDKNAKNLIGETFGVPIIETPFSEVDIIRNGSDCGIAEMRQTEIIWENKKAFLICMRDVTESTNVREELRKLAIVDPLTNLLNRRGFFNQSEQLLNLALRDSQKMFLMYIDMDNLKLINDNIGHTEGDLAIRDFSQILNETFRDSDVISRMGGDEFAILGADKHDQAARTLQERLESNIDKYNAREKASKLSASVGFVYFDPENPATIDDMIIEADKSMYQIKRQKKDKSRKS